MAQAPIEQLIENSRELREKLLADRHRPAYHFTVPEGYCRPFDPNGCIFWKGQYHLFYIFQDDRGHNWGHVSSLDLVHWRHHPTGLVTGMFSGNCFVNKDGVPTICHHQVDLGNSMVVSLDEELNSWEKLESNPITPVTAEGDEHHGKYRSWDPSGWLENVTYYAIFGGKRAAIAKSDTLEGPWHYVGDLMAHPIAGVDIDEDISCADLYEFGDRHMLLCISHRMGCRYYLGDWKNEQFYPEFHAQMSWADNGFFAPRSLLDDRGRRIMWAWILDGRDEEARNASGWSGTMCLPRVLSPAPDRSLLITVPEELEALRYNPREREHLTVLADSETIIEDVRGDTLEMCIEFAPSTTERVGVKVCRSDHGEEETLIYYDSVAKKLTVDTRRSGGDEEAHGPGIADSVAQKVESGPFELAAGEPLELRIFVDRSVVEVFANKRQAVMRRIYPTREDSLGVSLWSIGGDATATSLRAWDVAASNPY
jgi:beta-fructofuranosidase